MDDRSFYPPQPAAGIIHVHDAGPDRLVLDIPPGKHAGGLGCFAILWNGFMVVFTSVFALAGAQAKGKNDAPVWLFVVFVSVFWLVGFGLIYAWLKLRFERCFLLVDRERAVLRKMFLGRQRQTELPLEALSRAQLTESYKQNDVPVYRVTVTGAGGNTLHFGTSLAQPEKDWCVDAINALLQPAEQTVPAVERATQPLVCDACGATIPDDAFRSHEGLVICPQCEHEQVVAETATSTLLEQNESLPDELPGVVTVLEDSPERLGLRLRLSEYAAATWFIGLFGLGFAAFWYSFILNDFSRHFRAVAAGAPGGAFDWFGLIFLIPFLIGGLMPLGLSLLVVGGRLTTWIDRELVKVRLHVGPFGKTWTLPTAEITAVRLIDSSEMPSRMGNPRVAGGNPRVRGSSEISKAAGIFAGTKFLSMTALHQPLTARFVVAKVSGWLQENASTKRN